MGYTHYWYQKRDFTNAEWARIVDCAKGVFAIVPCPLAEEYDSPEKPPVANALEIRFNGVGEEGHETFLLTLNKRARMSYEDADKYNTDGAFESIKTNQKPYDEAVMAILCVAYDVAPDALRVMSDGSLDDWEDGAMLASLATGREINIFFGG